MALTLPFKSTNLQSTVLQLIMTVTTIYRATLVTTDMALPVSTTSMAIPPPITPFIMDRGAGHLDFEGIEKMAETKIYPVQKPITLILNLTHKKFSYQKKIS